ncbi:MAG: mannose-1-phosphate guanylyltransferase/mannose-6-phosphate isomerase [Marinicaulis sp.]|nr:mannose-1-phosphate guanylyltransferase/mannose-6-phosphate isomerase [Marinicaulis sp.]
MKIQPVIMSGGAGTRLWPMSRQAKPKQFLPLVTDQSMFQETALRVRPAPDNEFENPVVIAGGGHGALIAEQLLEVDIEPGEIILEPCPRNTAAVAAVAASWVAKNHDDALILLMPADHHIADPTAFHQSVAHAALAAKKGFIATFGIKPTHAHTGYGYIECGDAIIDSVYKVAAFKEKPQEETAQEYLDHGGYFWNAGIFLYKASAMLAEMEKLAPEIKAASVDALDKALMSGSALRLNEPAFSACPPNSVDYAVMEKTDKAAIVAPVDVGWTDIGSWSEVASQSDAPNVIEVDGAKNNIIRTDGAVIAAAGVNNLIIIATGDSILVARRDNAQEVRAVVDELKERGRTDLL